MNAISKLATASVGQTILFIASAADLSNYESQSFRVEPCFPVVAGKALRTYSVMAIYKPTGELVTVADFPHSGPAQTFADMARIVSKSFE